MAFTGAAFEFVVPYAPMRTQTFPLRPDAPDTQLNAYLLNNSLEFQTGQRRPAIIVCPGGGYQFLSDREAEPIALRFSAQGYHAFVLRYSVGTRLPAPMLDLASAIALVRANADEWLVDPDRIVVCGFSAGGHLAASLGVFWDKPFICEPLGLTPEQIRPNAVLMCYAVIELEVISNRPVTVGPDGHHIFDPDDTMAKLLGGTRLTQVQRDAYRLDLQVSASSAPAFIWHTGTDQIVPAHNALRFAAALARHQVPYELHIFENGVHGLALADEVTAIPGQPQFVNPDYAVWVELALNWLQRRF